MEAAVPRIMPAPVILAGEVIVGDAVTSWRATPLATADSLNIPE